MRDGSRAVKTFSSSFDFAFDLQFSLASFSLPHKLLAIRLSRALKPSVHSFP